MGDLAEVIRRGALSFRLPDGAGLGFLVMSRDGVRAYRDSCPHVPGSGLAWRDDAYLDGKREFIFCGSHGARFRLEDGGCISGPCVGERLTSLPLEIGADGAIFLAP